MSSRFKMASPFCGREHKQNKFYWFLQLHCSSYFNWLKSLFKAQSISFLPLCNFFSTWALLITVHICKCEYFINNIVKKDLWKYKYSYWIDINSIVTTIDFFFENWAKPAKPNFSLGFFFISIVYSLEALPVTDPPFCT